MDGCTPHACQSPLAGADGYVVCRDENCLTSWCILPRDGTEQLFANEFGFSINRSESLLAEQKATESCQPGIGVRGLVKSRLQHIYSVLVKRFVSFPTIWVRLLIGFGPHKKKHRILQISV